MSNEEKGLTYVKVDSYSSMPILKVPNEAFIDLMKKFNVSTLFMRESKTENGVRLSEFMFFYEGLMYVCSGYGYRTLADIKEAGSLGFNSSSAKYYVSEGNAYSVEGRYRDDHSSSSDGEVYYFARGLGYSDFKEFDDAVSKGFKSAKADDYRFAVSRGLKSYSEYEDYKKFRESMAKAGFSDEDEYKRALELGIPRKDGYDDYLFLERLRAEYKFETFQEAHLFIILNRKGLGREKNLETILETLQREQPDNWDSEDMYSRRNEFEWYTQKFRDFESVEKFLSTDPAVSKIGIYYPERKTFVSFSDKTILVDGSNIAYNSGDKLRGGKPYARNIRLVVNELLKKGYSDVKVFHDANLPYIIEDKDVFKELTSQGVLRLIPANTQADDFLLKFAKEYGAYIVTNDTFKDWAEKDAWVAANAKNFRIGFMIEDGVVKFSANYDIIDLSTFGGVDVSGFGGFRSMHRGDKETKKTIFEKSTSYARV